MAELKGNRFLVIGRAGMDLYADPPGARVDEAERFTTALGGSSANIAAGLCRLGASAALLTAVSDDAVGQFALRQLDRYGIDRSHVHVVGGEARNSLALVASRLDDTQSVIYRNGAADFEMTEAMVEAVDYTTFDALVTTGTVFAAEPSRSAAFRALDLARAAGLTIVFDIDYRPYSWPSARAAEDVYQKVASRCDIIVGNDDEFGFLAGGYDKGRGAARALVMGSGRIVVYKMGEKGSVTYFESDEITTDIFPTTALKPTGAGDSFMAGFLAALAEPRPLKEALARGTAAAAIVVSRVGCAPAMPTGAELDTFLGQHAHRG